MDHVPPRVELAELDVPDMTEFACAARGPATEAWPDDADWLPGHTALHPSVLERLEAIA